MRCCRRLPDSPRRESGNLDNNGDACRATGSENRGSNRKPIDAPISLAKVELQQGSLPSANPRRCSSAKVGAAEGTAFTAADLKNASDEIACNVTAWDSGSFTFVKKLQDAVRNHGDVQLIKRASDGMKLAVKRMPNRWVTTGPVEFDRKYPRTAEHPWRDIALGKMFESRGYPYSCSLVGVFRDEESTYVATTLATEGDIFSWCDREPRPGKAREEFLFPLIIQVFAAVRWIHELGVAHRDISLENLLLTPDPNTGALQIKLIDFGMATLARKCKGEIRGKQSYQAPEMHINENYAYDAFLTDAFAVGVVVFAMMVEDYPWIATQRQQCQLFDYVYTRGFAKFLTKRKLRKGKGEFLIDVLSKNLAHLLEGLLMVQPDCRASLGESCWEDRNKSSKVGRFVWDYAWCESWRDKLAYGGGPP